MLVTSLGYGTYEPSRYFRTRAPWAARKAPCLYTLPSRRRATYGVRVTEPETCIHMNVRKSKSLDSPNIPSDPDRPHPVRNDSGDPAAVSTSRDPVHPRDFDWPKVWAIVLNWRNPDMTSDCVRLLEKCGYPNLEVLVVDNGSYDGSHQILVQNFPQHHHLSLPVNLGYAGGNAVGMLRALRDPEAFAVLVLNNDCMVTEGFLEPLVEELLEHQDTAVAGPVQLNYRDDRLVWANAGSVFDLWHGRVVPAGPSGRSIPNPGDRAVVGFHCGACSLYRADAIRDLGTFDPRLFLFGEEADWSFRASRRGWRTVVVTASTVVHLESLTTSKVPRARNYYVARNTAWLIRRHGNLLQVLVHALRMLFGSGLRYWASRVVIGQADYGWAILKGELDGLFANCSYGELPEDAAAEQKFEVAELEGSMRSFAKRLAPSREVLARPASTFRPHA